MSYKHYVNIKNNNDFFRKCYALSSFNVLRIYFYVSLNLVGGNAQPLVLEFL